jgi:TonB family protein
MRKVIIAALALSPMLLHAQANSPAKTQTSTTAQVLESKLAKPEAIADSDGAVATVPTQRISTGVKAPKLISTVDVVAGTNSLWNVIPVERSLVVSLVVDQHGKPEDVKIVKSAGATQLDENVLDAVSQYRFKPGTLDNQPVSVPVNLEITVQHGAY